MNHEPRYVDIAPLLKEVSDTLFRLRNDLRQARKDEDYDLIRRYGKAVKVLQLFQSSIYALPKKNLKPIIYASLSKGIGGLSYCGHCQKLTHAWNYCENCGAELVNDKKAKELTQQGYKVFVLGKRT